MKQLITILVASVLMLSGYISKAQPIDFYANTTTKVKQDSMRNSETSYVTTLPTALYNSGLAGIYDVQWTGYNDSATTSITLVLQSSVNGVNFVNHFGTVGSNCVTCDTLTTGSITGSDSVSKMWHVQPLQLFQKNDSTQVITQSGRRLAFRVKQVHANGGKSRSKASLTTSN